MTSGRIAGETIVWLKRRREPCTAANLAEYRKRLEAVAAQNRGQAVTFAGKSSPHEMAHIVRNYAVKLNTARLRFTICRDHLWARLSGRGRELDILFRLAHE